MLIIINNSMKKILKAAIIQKIAFPITLKSKSKVKHIKINFFNPIQFLNSFKIY